MIADTTKISDARWRAMLRFRSLMFNARSNTSNLTSSWSAFNDTEDISDGLDRLLEEIEYNRATAGIGANFAMAFTALGLFTICINIIILAILSANRRLVLQQVFYLLIINFAIIDTLKGVCLASHALRFIIPPSVFEDRKVLGTKIDQHVFIFFRLFNLATVFNLLMITLNEYVFIRFPLRYHQIVKRKLVLILVFIAWLISIAFTVASSLVKGKDETVFISTNSTFFRRINESEDGSVQNRKVNVRRSHLTNEMDLHAVFMFALTGFCVFSLLVVLGCYVTFFNIIRKIQKYDRRAQADANPNRRVSEVSLTTTDMHNFDERKIKRQLLKRYKYVLVIGSVILVYMLYLISYSTIQILQHINLDKRAALTSERMRSMLITRWILLLLCGLHSAIQPTCYFRMREFRGIVLRIIFTYLCRKKKARYHNRDEPRSEFTPPVLPGYQLRGSNCPNYRSIDDDSGNWLTKLDKNGMTGQANVTSSPPKETVVRYNERQSFKNPIVSFTKNRPLRLV